MESKFKRNIAIIFAGIVAAFLVLGFLLNLNNVTEPLEEQEGNDIAYGDLISLIKENLLEKVVWKDAYINLNGLYAKMTGRKNYNDVAVLKNGMLTTGRYEEIDITQLANAVGSMDERHLWHLHDFQCLKYFVYHRLQRGQCKCEPIPGPTLSGVSRHRPQLAGCHLYHTQDLYRLRYYRGWHCRPQLEQLGADPSPLLHR